MYTLEQRTCPKCHVEGSTLGGQGVYCMTPGCVFYQNRLYAEYQSVGEDGQVHTRARGINAGDEPGGLEGGPGSMGTSAILGI